MDDFVGSDQYPAGHIYNLTLFFSSCLVYAATQISYINRSEMKKMSALPCLSLLCASLLSISQMAQATVVQFSTSLGPVEVNLFDETTPETVANFLAYVESGRYNNSIVHRSEPGFVIQGGGFAYDSDQVAVAGIATDPSVVNEPVLSNVRGTIAMAKIPGSPNSATSQWFFNLANNSGSLDLDPNGNSFTVFGVVLEDGMERIDAIANLSRTDARNDVKNVDGQKFGDNFASLPIQNPRSADEVPNQNHYVLIESIDVTNPNINTFPDSLPPATTRGTSSGSNAGGGSSSGGSFGFGFIFISALMLIKRLGYKR